MHNQKSPGSLTGNPSCSIVRKDADASAGGKAGGNRRLRIWYMLCFFALGIIDQRRGSATGEVQMAAANAVGLAAAAMLFPTLKYDRLNGKVYKVCRGIAIPGGIAAGLLGRRIWPYQGQWITAVINAVVWGFLFLYILQERETVQLRKKVCAPLLLCVEGMLSLMLFSAHGGAAPFLYMIVFGGLYIIGLPKGAFEDFFQGMLNGIILWFFVQQSIAFGFRPYDTIRYRGLYSGETQNGLFYLIVYCAFLAKWLYFRERGHRLMQGISFFLAAGCVSFVLYTGGRSAFLGVVLASAVAYVGYDIFFRKSFYRFLIHGMLFLLCVAITFPLVYGCIRYLPTLLHHPIWFEGEYGENSSVRSYDPWDSGRYTTFEKAVYENLGRILQVIGIDLSEWRERMESSAVWGLKVYAMADAADPEGTLENPYIAPGLDVEGAMELRQAIHLYYFKRLNLFGHDEQERGFYIYRRGQAERVEHAHNMFLQIAYDHGILAGFLFAGIYGYSLWQAFRRHSWQGLACAAFSAAIFGFGMFEMAVVSGQITVSLVGILFYLASSEPAVGKVVSK
jgi:hypothetical protein